MDGDLTVGAVRFGWLTLAFMMLLSRAAFQWAGPGRMRAFLDRWKTGGVKRVWGAVSLAYAAFLLVAVAVGHDGLGALDVVLLVGLLLVLVADGGVNVLPAGFETFKDTVQERWVARHRGTAREDDRAMFGTINLALAVASAAAAAVVILYAPIAAALVVAAAVAATVLTAALIAATVRR